MQPDRSRQAGAELSLRGHAIAINGRPVSLN